MGVVVNRIRRAIPLAIQREDIDERMMPDGMLRKVTNARFRRQGGLESCPGWQTIGPMTQSQNDQFVPLVPVAYGNSVRVAASRNLVYRANPVVSPNRFYSLGDLPQLAAPRRYNIASGTVYPMGAATLGDKVYVAYVDSADYPWISRLTIDGDRLFSNGDFNLNEFDTYTVYPDAIALTDGYRYIWVGTSSGLVRFDMDNPSSAFVQGGTPTGTYRSLQALLYSSNVCLIYENSDANGTLSLCVPDHPSSPTVATLVTDMSTNTSSARRKWHACLGLTNEGSQRLFLAYEHTSGDWRYTAFETTTWTQTTAIYNPSNNDYESVIGPRLDAGDGIYVWRSGIGSGSTSTEVFALRLTDAGAWTAILTSYRVDDIPGGTATRWDRMDPIATWSTSGNLSLLPLVNWSTPLFDRGHVLAARTYNNSVIELSIESVFSPGVVHRNFDASVQFPTRQRYDWVNTPTSVDSNGIFRVAVPISRYTYSDTERPETVALYQWSPSSRDHDADGVAVSAVAGGLTLLSGGYVAAYDGERAFDLGFAFGTPELTALAGAGTGAVTANYQYVVIWEWTDATGARHRSAPSKVYSVSPSSNQYVALTISRRSLPSGMNNVLARVYRTEDDGVTFYEISNNEVTALGGGGWNVTGDDDIEVRDFAEDQFLIQRPILYTQGESGALGGQLPYAPPPACRSLAASPTRVCCAGLERAEEVHWSHEFFPGEPPVWSDSDSMRMRLPDEVVAVAWGGTHWLIFGRDKVWAVNGTGPDVSGAGEWNTPIEVQSPTGAHSPLSLAETTIGVVFQGTDGKVYVIGYGAITTEPLGPPVWYSLVDASESGDWVRSIVEVDRGGVRTIVVDTGSIRLCYDVEHRAWTEETLELTGRGANIGGDLYWTGDYSSSYYLASDDDATNYPSIGSQQDITLQLGRIFPWGQDGLGRLRHVIMLLSSSSGGDLTVTDEDDSTSSQMSGVVGSDFEGADGGAWARYVWGVPRQKRESLLATFVADGLGTWRFHSIALDVERIGGGRRRQGGDGQGQRDINPWDYEFDDEFGP